MGFFNNLGKKTSEATNKITKETKLKLKINENKNKITDIYEEIGKKVYEKHTREENISIKEELEEECSKIDELSKEIEEARKEILKLNNKKQCSNCYAEVEKDAVYCSKCGQKLQTVEVVEPEQVPEEAKTTEVEENEEATQE